MRRTLSGAWVGRRSCGRGASVRAPPRMTWHHAGVSDGRHPRIQSVSEEARVTPIELFFDLIFVFSLTQVTALMAGGPTGRGVVFGLFVVAPPWGVFGGRPGGG